MAQLYALYLWVLPYASMRPGRFHPGNAFERGRCTIQLVSFNEAGAFPPRKYGNVLDYPRRSMELQ